MNTFQIKMFKKTLKAGKTNFKKTTGKYYNYDIYLFSCFYKRMNKLELIKELGYEFVHYL